MYILKDDLEYSAKDHQNGALYFGGLLAIN
jgi:hypothetical protein